jgi:hypothetical protein
MHHMRLCRSDASQIREDTQYASSNQHGNATPGHNLKSEDGDAEDSAC